MVLRRSLHQAKTLHCDGDFNTIVKRMYLIGGLCHKMHQIVKMKWRWRPKLETFYVKNACAVIF